MQGRDMVMRSFIQAVYWFRVVTLVDKRKMISVAPYTISTLKLLRISETGRPIPFIS
jgi:hypothetical protein